MKKVSTAAAKQSKNFSQQKLTMGLDLGDRSSWYCVLDETGVLLLEQKLSTTPEAMREVFSRSPRVRMEGWRQRRLGGQKSCPTNTNNKNPLDSDRPSHGRALALIDPSQQGVLSLMGMLP